MDYKQGGHNGAHLLSAEFANTTARKGQKVDMHHRYMRANHLTKKELQRLAQTQNGIIGSLVDDDGQIRVYVEVVIPVVEFSELHTEYDLNRFEIENHTHYRDGVQGFSVWSNFDKAKWVLYKVEFDPPMIDNLGIAAVDMVRHDLDQLDDMQADMDMAEAGATQAEAQRYDDAARDPLYPADHFDAMMRYAIDTAARRGVCDGLHVDLATGGASVVRRPGAPPKHLYDVAATFRDARRGEPC
jgi:hypothetical protein